MRDNLAAAELRLSADEVAALDDVSGEPLRYPYWHQARTSADRLDLAVSLLKDPVFEAFLTGTSPFAELPGLDEKDVELTIDDGVLTLRGNLPASLAFNRRSRTERITLPNSHKEGSQPYWL